MENYGYIEIKLDAYMRRHKYSRSKLSREANIQYKQIIKYCNNDVQSISFDVLARICKALGCKVNDILEYME